jgi:hypothetical protein
MEITVNSSWIKPVTVKESHFAGMGPKIVFAKMDINHSLIKMAKSMAVNQTVSFRNFFNNE